MRTLFTNRSVYGSLALALTFAACGGGASGDSLDQERLAKFRSAIPSEGRLEAAAPAGVGRAAGDAIFPEHARNGVRAINGAAVGVVELMRTITSFPPSLYNSETNEYLWGPWDKDDGQGDGQVAAYIRENDPDTNPDFQYDYALIRMVGSDVATGTVVIAGGASPDENAGEDMGTGVTLWDFEANRQFEIDNGFSDGAGQNRGRFVAYYGRMDTTTEEGAAGTLAFNVAVFRNFIDENAEADATPADLDYFFGEFTGTDGNVITFLDWKQTSDLCDAAALDGTHECFDDKVAVDAAENMRIRLAFLNAGAGRAEVNVTGGDLGENSVTATECWSKEVEATYLTISAPGPETLTFGSESQCGLIFTQSLDELDIPSIDDLPADDLAKMIKVAEDGLE